MIPEMRFVTIGYIEWRKGQDILLDAIEMLPRELVSSCLFSLVGQDTSLMAGEIKERIKDKPWIEMPGTMPREKIHEMLDKADVLICPSREDPMPTVCAEAMMHSLPCLVSDAAGTAAYIRDGYDGLLFKSGEAAELSERIAWCIEHKAELKQMGEKAYEIYEKHFSIRSFEANILRYVDEMIKK